MEYIYILSNLYEVSAGTLKIGRTDKHPEVRANELSKQTSALDKYIVEWFVEVPNSKIAEKIVHDKLSNFRINPKREFFKLDIEEAIGIAYETLKEYYKTSLKTYRRDSLPVVFEDINQISNNEEKLKEWWQKLPPNLKFAYKNELPEEYFNNNIDNFLEKNSLDEVYYLLRKDYIENRCQELEGWGSIN